MATMDPIFEIFTTGIRFPGGLMQGNNTYTYVASFPVTFPGLDTQVQNYDPGIFTGMGDSIFFNSFGADIFFALDTIGTELPLPGTYTIAPGTNGDIWGHWPHLQYGVTFPGGRRRWYVDFDLGGTPAGGGGSLTITVRVYMKPSNARESGIFEGPDYGGESRPNGGNYPGSFYGV